MDECKIMLIIRFLMYFTYGILTPVMSIYLNNLTKSLEITSYISSFPSIGSILVDLILLIKPSLLIGKKPFFIFSTYFTIRTLFYLIFKNPYIYALVFFLNGFSATLLSINLVYLYRKRVIDKVKGLSILSFLTTLSTVISNYTGGILATISTELPFYFSIAISFPILILHRKMKFDKPKKMKVKENLLNFKSLWILGILLSMMTPLIYTYAQIFMKKEGDSFFTIGITYSVSSLLSAIIPLIISKKVFSYSPLLSSIVLLPLLINNFPLTIILYSIIYSVFMIYRGSLFTIRKFYLSSLILSNMAFFASNFLSYLILPSLINIIGIKGITIAFTLSCLIVAMLSLKNKSLNF